MHCIVFLKLTTDSIKGLQEDTDDMQNPGTDEELQKFINDKEVKLKLL